MIEILLDSEYRGPTIIELASSVPDITDQKIKVQWTNSKDEVRALREFKRDFVLYVADSHTFDRAVATFGKRLKVPPAVTERAKFVLTDKKGYDWRNFTDGLKDTSPRFLLLKLAADAIRKGIQPSLAEIVANVFLDGISHQDADVLIRLKSGRMRG